MKILITGATGFVGKSLTNRLLSKGYEINVLTRDKSKAKSVFPDSRVVAFEWKNNLELPPLEALEGVRGIINLMGENIGAKKWSADQKKKLKESRVDATKNLVKLVETNLTSPLEFFISASAIGIYPVNNKNILNEDSAPGHTFLAELCKMWEDATLGLSKTKRKIIIRTGVVLEKEDGALKKMLPPFKMGLGGPIGNGNQMMSWIHLDDLVNLYETAASDATYNGVYNGVAPTPVCNFDFTKALGDALHRPTLFPVPTLPLKIVFGEMSTIILDSQAVVSKRLLEKGFHFKYETVDAALNAVFGKK
jgi:uncharacterized protein (TIGR01777 family)